MTVPPVIPVDDSLSGTGVRPDSILRIAWSGGAVSRLCSTFGGLRLPADDIETTDRAYYAYLPVLGQAPALTALINGISDSVEFGISGLPSDIAEMADAEAEEGQGAIVRLGKVYWDRDWKMIGGARWAWGGKGGTISTQDNGGARGQSPTFTIKLEAGTNQIRRASAGLNYWTDAEHQKLSPGDTFFRLTNKLSTGYNKTFPRF